MRTFSTLLTGLLFFSLLGCGGNKDNSSTSHPPTISNLSYTPTYALVGTGSGSVAVNGMFNFSDAGGDLVTMTLTIKDIHDSIISSKTIPVPDAYGITNGLLLVSTLASTATTTSYVFDISVTDKTHRSSNTLTGIFSVY